MTKTPPFIEGTINKETGEIITLQRSKQQPSIVKQETVPAFVEEPKDPRSTLKKIVDAARNTKGPLPTGVNPKQ